MKIDKKELRSRIKTEKAKLRDLRADERNSARLLKDNEKKANAQARLVGKLEAKLKK